MGEVGANCTVKGQFAPAASGETQLFEGLVKTLGEMLNAVHERGEPPLLVNVKLCEVVSPTFSVPKLNEVGVSAPVAPKVKLQTCRDGGPGSRFQKPRLVAAARKATFVARVEVTPFCVTCTLVVCPAPTFTCQTNVAGVPTIHDTLAAWP